MDSATDLFPDEPDKKHPLFVFVLIITLYLAFVFMFIVNYFSLHSPAFVISSPRILIASLVLHGIPLLTAGLFIGKTKAGWILMIFVNAITITFIVKAGLYDYYRQGASFGVSGKTIYSILNALAILALCFTGSVLRIFKLNRRLIIFTVLLQVLVVTAAFLFL